MSTLVSENFDGVTAPTIPAGWTNAADAHASATSNTGSIVSSPNVLLGPYGAGFLGMITYDTVCPSANVTVDAYMNFSAADSANQEGFVLARADRQVAASLNAYAGGMERGGLETHRAVIYKIVAGSGTVIGTPVTVSGGDDFGVGTWYEVIFDCTGTTISLKIRRTSDNTYLKNDGTWVSGVQTAVTVTDSSVSAAGRVGAYTFTGSGTSGAGWQYDNFVATYPSGGGSAFTLTGPSAGPVGANSGVFTVTPNATITDTFTPTPIAGCTFTPSSLSWAASATPKTFQVLKSAAGTVSINGTFGGGLTPPASVSYTAKAAVSKVKVVTMGPRGSSLVAITVKNLDGTSFVDRTTSGITELMEGVHHTGVYSTVVSVPSDGLYVPLWDDGGSYTS